MKAKTRRRLKQTLILIALVSMIGIGVGIYTMLGPFRIYFWNVPYLAGMLGRQHYLVLLQNNNELRPTGGFITAAAHVSMTFGVPNIDVFDSYAVPDPQPPIAAPEPFQYFIGQNDPFFAGWTFRDANFSPDFTVSAEEVIQLYQEAYPERELDAVIALDFGVIERFLRMYGPLTIDGVEFTADNFFIQSQRISKNVDTHDAEALQNRKNVLKPFVKALIRTIIRTPTRYPQLFEELGKLAKEKHLLAYHRVQGIQAKHESLGMAQNITPPNADSDVLHINVANIGGRKADRYVSKEIKYRADFSNPSQPVSKLEVSLEHLGSYNIQSDIYQAYIRSYVPMGSELIRSEGQRLRPNQTITDLGMTAFADYIRLKPGEKVVLSYWYRLPETILPEQYRLRVIKQPGTENQYWHLAVKQVNDSALRNAPDQTGTRTPMTIRENLAIWRGELDEDKDFRLFQQYDDQGPIVLWQKFVDRNTINVRFNERLDPLSAENPENYIITDLNKNDRQSDTITIEDVEFDERDLWISVDGVTNQPEEHYQIILQDLSDLNGNTTEPNPLQRTLVQRLSSETE